MRYMYTTTPDKHCHEVEPGVFGRPVHSHEEPKLKKQGWSLNITSLRGADDVREKEEGRQEEVEVSDESGEDKPDTDLVAENDLELARIAYEKQFGKKPHHKAKLETIVEKLRETDGND